MRTIIFILCALISLSATANTVYHQKLNNGLNVYVKINTRSPVVISQLWYKVGGSYEHNGITGISHVLEHMMFEGTSNHPSGYFSQTIQSLGGVQNAMTTDDYTMYFQILPKQYLSTAFKLEADQMQNLHLTEAHFQKEMAIVKTEKRMRYDTVPIAKQYVRFRAMAFISNPYHHPTIGWQNDLDNMTLADVKAWYQRFYHPNNADLIVVGDVKPEAVFALAKQYFGAIPAHTIDEPKPRIGGEHLSNRTETTMDNSKLTTIMIGFNVPNYIDAKNKKTCEALAVLTNILGGNSSALLTSELVRKQGVATDIDATYSPFDLHNTLLTITAVPKNTTDPTTLTQSILKMIRAIQIHGVSKAQLQFAKTQILAKKTYALDSLTEEANAIGELTVVGLPWQTRDNFIAGIQTVTSADVQRVAQQYLTPNRLSTSYLIPDSSTALARNPHA